MGLGWKAIKFGLTINWLSSKVVGYLLLLHASIALGLAPWVVGQQFGTIVGFGLGLVIVAVFLGMIKRAFNTDSAETAVQIAFAFIATAICQLHLAQPKILEAVLTLAERYVPVILLFSAAAFVFGSCYCVIMTGGFFRWLFSLLALLAMLGATLLTIEHTKFANAHLVIPNIIRDSWFYASPFLGAIILGCLGVLFHAISLWSIAGYFHDEPTGRYAGTYAAAHVVMSLAAMGLLYVLLHHELKPVFQVGDAAFDSIAILCNALAGLLFAVDSIWLSRTVAGAKDLIDPFRRH